MSLKTYHIDQIVFYTYLWLSNKTGEGGHSLFLIIWRFAIDGSGGRFPFLLVFVHISLNMYTHVFKSPTLYFKVPFSCGNLKIISSYLFPLFSKSVKWAYPSDQAEIGSSNELMLPTVFYRWESNTIQIWYWPFCFSNGGLHERRHPLPQIMQSRFPHLGNSQGSAYQEGRRWTSPWENHLCDHGISPYGKVFSWHKKNWVNNIYSRNLLHNSEHESQGKQPGTLCSFLKNKYFLEGYIWNL